jgi:hypothetical protein
VQTKWSHVPLTFDTKDVDLRSAPHLDAMVINCSVAGWDLHKVLVDNGSQADIIFLHAFDRMGISHNLLKPSDNPLDPATPKQTVVISEDLTSQDKEKLVSCLSRNKDVFAWSAHDLVGVSRTVIEHSLGIDSSVRPKKQRLRKMSDEKTEAAKAEVHHLLEANFIEPIAYPTWLANVVMVQKKSGKWRMCIDFTSLNKACPKDNFPLPRIDKIVDSVAGCEVMSLLDCFSGYH